MALKVKEGLVCSKVLSTFFPLHLFIQNFLRTFMTAMQPLIATVSSAGRKSLTWNQTLRSKKWTAERKVTLELNPAFVPSPPRWPGPKAPPWKHMESTPFNCQGHEGWRSTLSMFCILNPSLFSCLIALRHHAEVCWFDWATYFCVFTAKAFMCQYEIISRVL